MVSNSYALNKDSNGTHTTLDKPSRTAFTCSSNSCNLNNFFFKTISLIEKETYLKFNARRTYSKRFSYVIRLYLLLSGTSVPHDDGVENGISKF